jgi:hypothetical protein
MGADGAQLLALSGYYAAGPAREASICRRAMATTLVDGGPVHVCRRFDTLSDDEAAVVLLHEALHHAGLRERPQDPDGMEPSAISRMVRSACGP